MTAIVGEDPSQTNAKLKLKCMEPLYNTKIECAGDIENKKNAAV